MHLHSKIKSGTDTHTHIANIYTTHIPMPKPNNLFTHMHMCPFDCMYVYKMMIAETAPLTARALHTSIRSFGRTIRSSLAFQTIVTNGIENGHTHVWLLKTIYIRVRCIRCIHYTANTHTHT